jgi:hypothetical protein
MLFIVGGKEGALVMVEPPGEPGRRAVLEIDYGIIVAVEQLLLDELLVRLVRKPAESDLGGRFYLLFKKARENRG